MKEYTNWGTLLKLTPTSGGVEQSKNVDDEMKNQSIILSLQVRGQQQTVFIPCIFVCLFIQRKRLQVETVR